MYVVIAPFWLSTEHLWILLVIAIFSYFSNISAASISNQWQHLRYYIRFATKLFICFICIPIIINFWQFNNGFIDSSTIPEIHSSEGLLFLRHRSQYVTCAYLALCKSIVSRRGPSTLPRQYIGSCVLAASNRRSGAQRIN